MPGSETTRKKSSTDTPLMRQFLEVKATYPDALLFFRMGDFYELFFDDAVVASQLLDLTLTSRDKNKDEPIPMAGVPHHAVNGYIRKALEHGRKVALCDQIEDPRTAKGLVKRAVTRVITPGVVLDADHLDAKTSNYLVAIVARETGFGIAALDLSTFDLRSTQLTEYESLVDELARLAPKEVVWTGRLSEQQQTQLNSGIVCSWHPAPADLLLDDRDACELVELRGRGTVKDLGLSERPLAIAATSLALRYAEATQPGSELPFFRIRVYSPADHLQMDEATLCNLELFESMMERRRKGSLLWVLDATCTAMGGRLMRHLLGRPLTGLADIQRRLDAVELLAEQSALRDELRQVLRQVFDMERLCARVVMQAATPREVARLGHSAQQLPAVAELSHRVGKASLTGEAPEWLRWPEDVLADVAHDIAAALVDDPPALIRDGGVIRQGHDDDLDEVVRLCEGGRSDIAAIELRERERTGISSLRVRFNKVFGYFIEITRSNLNNVPEDYQRKQTLVNAERFTTAELAEYESRVLDAQERRAALELELFEKLRARVAAQADRLTAAASRLAQLDVLCGLADVAERNNYVRPAVDEAGLVSIEEGRHPVVEQFQQSGEYVPNDVTLDTRDARLLVLTGPNMSGKSTVMRQVALITLMAQMGSFVPARKARIGIVDRLFTRVGASDNLAKGESTFMVEMRETAAILRNASERSLVILDEIGRGTATYDGISIAWAVAEYLHDRVKCKGMFATHYHELCALAEVKSGVRNFNVAVHEWDGKIVFMRRLVPGGSSRSYGIEVARLAGMDRWVVERSRKVLAALEDGDADGEMPIRARPGSGCSQMELFGSGGTPLQRSAGVPKDEFSTQQRAAVDRLRAVDPNSMTPIEALNFLSEAVSELT